MVASLHYDRRVRGEHQTGLIQPPIRGEHHPGKHERLRAGTRLGKTAFDELLIQPPFARQTGAS
jgi:hypothetical protein